MNLLQQNGKAAKHHTDESKQTEGPSSIQRGSVDATSTTLACRSSSTTPAPTRSTTACKTAEHPIARRCRLTTSTARRAARGG